MELPPSFRAFLRDNGVPEEAYDVEFLDRRFVRVPRTSDDDSDSDRLLEALSADQDGVEVTPVPWLNDTDEHNRFYQVRGADSRISHLEAYRAGQLLGIDAASCAAVLALQVDPHSTVLDLCCAPGAKMAMIAQRLHPHTSSGSVTAVDVSPARLAACTTLARKHHLRNVRLYLGDARQFALAVDSVGECAAVPNAGRASARHQQRVAAQATDTSTPLLYYHTHSFVQPLPPLPPRYFDRVLVDAQCTHDGSLRHIAKFGTDWGWDTFDRRVFADDADGVHLRDLQRALLLRGFNLLRPTSSSSGSSSKSSSSSSSRSSSGDSNATAGRLIYSTCSLTRAQNEDIVQWLLDTQPTAHLVTAAPPSAHAWPSRPAGPAGPSNPFPCLRFDPRDGLTSGLYIAAIIKRETV